MCLLSIKRLNRISIDILVVVRGKALHGLNWTADRTAMTAAEGLWARLLFDPEVFGRLKVIPKYRYDLQNLLIRILIDKETCCGFRICFCVSF